MHLAGLVLFLLLQGHWKCRPKSVSSSDTGHFALDQYRWLQLSFLLQPPFARQGLLTFSRSPGSCWAQSCTFISRLSLCNLSPAPPPPSETSCAAGPRSRHFPMSWCAKDTVFMFSILFKHFRYVDFCLISWPQDFEFIYF